ncbi:hypothetical protein W97_00323 [Coniosporium apollinis CBS 100218]|uniref:DUF2293 domain-containing protein n=1 Tax=Coniosporium apollinis (strain CBS 100218) TaxID=1168221 RepID=R7YGU3_CONA1|nr:uncharacterized protein W97_00323 [Coniosporium apollinis CBS 100218]EON61112.1 hypothetical protein W97_00323 [Coniosporium apollinis CBS 100218]
MAKISHRATSARAGRKPSRVTNHAKKKPYKVVLESVTQEKKKLRTSLSYNAQAPVGYTFVPAGTPDLTAYCKEVCRKRNLNVFIVSVKPRKARSDPERLSHHIYRIGHHFPSQVVDQGCNWLGYTRRRTNFRKELDVLPTSRLAQSLETHSKRLGLQENADTVLESREQIAAAIRDLFPKIPDTAVDVIVEHAFREGTKRIGTVAELSLARRVQLAVLAHIRHQYTDYDRLLRSEGWYEARTAVAPVCLKQLLEWRGEGQDEPAELEDIFREIIVIDDDDDVDENDNSSNAGSDDTLSSMEIVTDPAAAHDLDDSDSNDVEWVDDPRADREPRRVTLLRPPQMQRWLLVSSAHQGYSPTCRNTSPNAAA